MTNSETPDLYNGILPVLKPVQYTSHDVVAKVRRILRTKRIGHTGTLDPQVTGVLPLCIGKATRLVEYIQDLPKEYEAVVRFGISTDTEDLTGEVIESLDRVELTGQQIEQAIVSFVGEIDQVPPMYSAVKVDGKRLYELAREGQVVERKSRKVTVHQIDIMQIDTSLPHPEVRFRVRCSKGTYIRTLCVDIGRKLGVPAVMAELTRTATGYITLDRCLTFEEIERLHNEGILSDSMIAPDEAIAHIPSAEVAPEKVAAAYQGQKISSGMLSPKPVSAGPLRLYAPAPDSRFIGIFTVDDGLRFIKPAKVFS